MTKKNNSKTSVGNVVFLGVKPDSPDIEPVVGEIVAKGKKVWQGVDYRFARDNELFPARRADPNELIGYCDVRTLGERRASGSSRDLDVRYVSIVSGRDADTMYLQCIWIHESGYTVCIVSIVSGTDNRG